MIERGEVRRMGNLELSSRPAFTGTTGSLLIYTRLVTDNAGLGDVM